MSAKRVKPFSEQKFFTVFNNAVLDHMMPQLAPTSWMVLCYIIRKTIGWHKESDELSLNNIVDGTSIKSKTTVIKALDDLVSRGWVMVTERPNDHVTPNTYALNLDLEVSVGGTKNVPPPSTKNEQLGGTKNELGGGTNSVPTKEREKETINKPPNPQGGTGGVFNSPDGETVFSFEDESEKDEDAEIRRSWEETLSLIALFEKLTGKKSDPLQRNGRYKTSFMDYWVTPLVNMQKVGNGHTAVAIERGIKEMDAKKLTVATPRSIEPTVLGILRRGDLEKASSRKTAVTPTPSTGEYGGII